MSRDRTVRDATLKTSTVRARSAAREHAREVSARLRSTSALVSALDATSDAVAIVDRSGVVLYTNPAFETLSGHEDGALLGHGIERFVPDTIDVRRIVRALQRDGSFRARAAARHAAGHGLRLDLRVVPATDDAGALQHFCLLATRVASDVPPPMSSEQTLLAPITRLVAEMAHDFNNQIAVVPNYSFVLGKRLPEQSALRLHVSEMQTSAWRASQVAQELLSLGGQRIAEAEALDLNELITALGGLLQHIVGEGIDLDVMAAATLPKIRARRPQLEWMLIELLPKARAHLGGAGHLQLETSELRADARGQAAVMLALCASKPVACSAERESREMPLPVLSAPAPGQLGMPGTELALTHTQGTVETMSDEDGLLIYRVRFPALS